MCVCASKETCLKESQTIFLSSVPNSLFLCKYILSSNRIVSTTSLSLLLFLSPGYLTSASAKTYLPNKASDPPFAKFELYFFT